MAPIAVKREIRSFNSPRIAAAVERPSRTRAPTATQSSMRPDACRRSPQCHRLRDQVVGLGPGGGTPLPGASDPVRNVHFLAAPRARSDATRHEVWLREQLMEEVAGSGDVHAETGGLGGFDHLRVADRTTRLYDGPYATIDQRLKPVREGEECVGCGDRAFRTI